LFTADQVAWKLLSGSKGRPKAGWGLNQKVHGNGAISILILLFFSFYFLF
jgi:hypothetical protein